MSSRYEVAVKLSSAKDLKNINWKYGPIRPYIVAWINPDRKVTTRVDEEGDTSPKWDHTLILPLYCPIEDATLFLDVIHHASPDEDIKPLIGSGKLDLHEVVEESGIGNPHACSLKLKRPSGRPHGKLKLEVTIREPQYHGSYNPYPPTQMGYGEFREGHPYEHPPATYGGPGPYAGPGYGQSVSEYRQPHTTYGEPTPYGDPEYGELVYEHGHENENEKKEEKKSRFGGMGTGLAIGAAAGVVGGVAAYAGYEHFKDHVADEAAERVEEDLDREKDDDDEEEEEEKEEEDDEDEDEEEEEEEEDEDDD